MRRLPRAVFQISAACIHAEASRIEAVIVSATVVQENRRATARRGHGGGRLCVVPVLRSVPMMQAGDARTHGQSVSVAAYWSVRGRGECRGVSRVRPHLVYYWTDAECERLIHDGMVLGVLSLRILYSIGGRHV